MAIICNMGAEIGATTSLFPFNRRMVDYLKAMRSEEIAQYAQRFLHNLQADKDAEYDRHIEIVRATIDRYGQIAAFEDVGGLILANACGLCIGQWDHRDVKKGEANSKRREPRDAPVRHAPKIVTAFAFAGDLRFNPLTDTLIGSDGKPLKFSDTSGNELPHKGYDPRQDTFQPPPVARASVQVAVDPNSERLRPLKPFQPWDDEMPTDVPILIKVKGNDGPHLCGRAVAQNCLIGAINAENGEANKVWNAKDEDGTKDEVSLAHSFNEGQIEWFKAGSALNLMAAKAKGN
ncbi:aconitase iron-sulfur domain-containing protein [Wolfiporia cocos MD-104 SS10]|uniref:Aconitase iron-sulfur domain-containing protein n=1 Tax=Wolfiporia cocos (strain MD-104) TaxID=742152 RepID=A0A2H3K4G9_WOLCO|nr:aconitase iron-sulfur domain-containing protein [Wolfiporia cocos MD-104 SS10]